METIKDAGKKAKSGVGKKQTFRQGQTEPFGNLLHTLNTL